MDFSGVLDDDVVVGKTGVSDDNVVASDSEGDKDKTDGISDSDKAKSISESEKPKSIPDSETTKDVLDSDTGETTNVPVPAANSGSLTAARDDESSDTSEVCPSDNSNATSSPFNAKQHLIFISTYDYDNPPLNAVSKRMALGPPPKKRRRSVLASSESKVPHLAAVANSDSDKLCFSTESTPESNKQALLKEKLYSNKLLEDDSAHK